MLAAAAPRPRVRRARWAVEEDDDVEEREHDVDQRLRRRPDRRQAKGGGGGGHESPQPSNAASRRCTASLGLGAAASQSTSRMSRCHLGGSDASSRFGPMAKRTSGIFSSASSRNESHWQASGKGLVPACLGRDDIHGRPDAIRSHLVSGGGDGGGTHAPDRTPRSPST